MLLSQLNLITLLKIEDKAPLNLTQTKGALAVLFRIYYRQVAQMELKNNLLNHKQHLYIVCQKTSLNESLTRKRQSQGFRPDSLQDKNKEFTLSK